MREEKKEEKKTVRPMDMPMEGGPDATPRELQRAALTAVREFASAVDGLTKRDAPLDLAAAVTLVDLTETIRTVCPGVFYGPFRAYVSALLARLKRQSDELERLTAAELGIVQAVRSLYCDPPIYARDRQRSQRFTAGANVQCLRLSRVAELIYNIYIYINHKDLNDLLRYVEATFHRAESGNESE